MSVELGSIWIDNDSDLLVIVKSLEGNCDGKVKVVFNYIVRTGSGCFEATSGLDLFLNTKTKLVRCTEKGRCLNKDEQNLNYRVGYNDGWHDCEASFELGNEFTDSIQEQAYDEGYDQAIDDLIESGVIGEEEYLDEDYSDEEYSEYEFGDVDDDEDGEEEYCFSKELERVLNSEFTSSINFDEKTDEKTEEDLDEYNRGYEDGKSRGITLGYNKRDYEYSKANNSDFWAYLKEQDDKLIEDDEQERLMERKHSHYFKELERVLDSELATNIKSDEDKKEDLVNNPSHYNSDPSGVKCIEITRHRNNNIGNVIKYVWRNGLKDGNSNIQDLEKAAWYLNDEIQRLKDIER